MILPNLIYLLVDAVTSMAIPGLSLICTLARDIQSGHCALEVLWQVEVANDAPGLLRLLLGAIAVVASVAISSAE